MNRLPYIVLAAGLVLLGLAIVLLLFAFMVQKIQESGAKRVHRTARENSRARCACKRTLNRGVKVPFRHTFSGL
jgi:hypothetical protein